MLEVPHAVAAFPLIFSKSMFRVTSIKAESDLHADLDAHRPAIFQGGLEDPLPNGFNRLGVQSKSQAANHA